MFRARLIPVLVFAGTFILLTVLYWPARNAGWVSDTLGWLDAVRTQSFSAFINRNGFGVRSLYQTTQVATWTFYQLFGSDRLAWHLLFIALQALNAALLFSFFRGLLRDSKLEHAGGIALLTVTLFSLSPYLSEVIVWEAAYHYLQGLLFIAVQLLLLQAFLRDARAVYAISAALVFAIASFSLELFYLTPVFTFLLLLYYRFGGPTVPEDLIRRASRSFLLPQLIILALHLVLIRVLFGTHTGRLGDGLWNQPLSYFAIKPPDYLLHLFGGRFLPQAARSAWHQVFCTYAGAGVFYAVIAASLSYIAFRFRKMAYRARLVSWGWCATLAAMALVTPMWFPERLLVMGDRYLYLMLPFFLFAISLCIWGIRLQVLRAVVVVILISLSAIGTVRLAHLWERSELLTRTMQERFPAIPSGGSVLLLNNPANLRGVPMSGAGPDGEFALMRRLLYPELPQVVVSEAFAAEYSEERPHTLVQQLGPATWRVSLAGCDRRWWFGPDYARVHTAGSWNATLRTAAAYDLTLLPGRGPILTIWNGAGFRFIVSDTARMLH